MATIDVTASSFERTVRENELVLVDFWARWCGPCRLFGPVFEASSEAHPDVVHAKVDTDAEPVLAGAARISSVPTLMAFREGLLVLARPGALAPSALHDVVGAVRALDMGAVRARMEQQRASRRADA